MTRWDELDSGSLTDDDIRHLSSNGELISQHFDPDNVKQACYELRTSTIFYETASQKENKRVIIEPGDSYILRPMNYITCIVLEHIQLPSDGLGRILTKGQLFSIGLLPVNTYADPGFDGRLGITLFNASKRYISLEVGKPIAKIEFTKLGKAVAHPYSGQHGFETEIWPIPTQYLLDDDGLRRRGIILGSIDELSKIHGEDIANLAWTLEYYRHRVWLQIGVVVVALGVLLSVHDRLSLGVSFLLGVAANFASFWIINLLGNKWVKEKLGKFSP